MAPQQTRRPLRDGRVALDAAFTYGWSYLHFPEQLAEEGLEPHMVEQAYPWGSESPDVFVEIGDCLYS